jgi:hypothetical protein
MKLAIESSSGEALSKLIGSVDPRGRPIVRIGQINGADDFLAIIDTGFNGQLMVSYQRLISLSLGRAQPGLARRLKLLAGRSKTLNGHTIGSFGWESQNWLTCS